MRIISRTMLFPHYKVRLAGRLAPGRPPERQSARVSGWFLLRLIAFLSQAGWFSTGACGAWRGQGCPA